MEDNISYSSETKSSFIQQFNIKSDIYSNNQYLTIIMRTSIIERILRKFLFPKSSYNSISLYYILTSITEDKTSQSYFESILSQIESSFTQETPLFVFSKFVEEIRKLLKEPNLSSISFEKFILKLEFLLAWHFENNFFNSKTESKPSSQQQQQQNTPPQPKTNFFYSIESLNTLYKFLKVFEKQGLSTRINDFYYYNYDLFCIEKVFYFYCDQSNINKKQSGNLIEYLLHQLNKKINIIQKQSSPKVLDIQIENYILINLFIIHKIISEYSFYLSKNPELESIFTSLKSLKCWPLPIGTACNEVIETVINEMSFQGITTLNKLRNIFFIDFLSPNISSINTNYFNTTMIVYSNDIDKQYNKHNEFNLSLFIERLVKKRVKHREQRLYIKELIVRIFITIMFNSNETFNNNHLHTLYDIFFPEIKEIQEYKEERFNTKEKENKMEDDDNDVLKTNQRDVNVKYSLDMLLKLIDTGLDMNLETFDENINAMARQMIMKCNTNNNVHNNDNNNNNNDYDNILYNECLLPITALRSYFKPKYNHVKKLASEHKASTFYKDLFLFYQKNFKYVVNNYFSHLLKTNTRDPIIEENLHKERNAIYNRYKVNLVLIEDNQTFSQFIKHILTDNNVSIQDEITNEDYETFWKYFVSSKSEIQPKYLLHIVPHYDDIHDHYFNNTEHSHSLKTKQRTLKSFYLSEYIASNDPIYKSIVFMPYASTGDKAFFTYIPNCKYVSDDIINSPNIDMMYSFLKKPLDYYISDSTGVMNLNLYQVKIHSEVDPHTLVVEPFWKNMTLIINETKETVITMKCVDCMGLERKEENVELVIKNALKIQVFNLFSKKDFPFNYNMRSNNGFLEVFICDNYSTDKDKFNKEYDHRNKGKFYDEVNVPQMDLDTLYKNYKVKSMTIKTDKQDPICVINDEEKIKFWEMQGKVVINISHYEKEGKPMVIPIATFISI